MSTKRNTSVDVQKLAYLALFTALVFVLQFLSLFMRPGIFSITFVLVPIVIAVAMCGVVAGPWLGFIFGVAVLVSGDAALFLTYSPFLTIVVVLLKGTLAGLAAALVYKLIVKKQRYVAVVAAAITAPIVNTGVFFIGARLIFMPLIEPIALEAGMDPVSFILLVMIGWNFLIEVGINLILVPTIYRIIELKKKYL